MFSLRGPAINETLPFIFNTPAMKRRLHGLKDTDNIDFLEKITNTLQVKDLDILQPDALSYNPLYVWGAAAMDGFFTDKDLPLAIKFMEEHFGHLPEHPLMPTFMEQNYIMSNLIAQIVHKQSALRFVKLCNRAGFLFPVRDSEGKELEGGTRYKVIAPDKIPDKYGVVMVNNNEVMME